MPGSASSKPDSGHPRPEGIHRHFNTLVPSPRTGGNGFSLIQHTHPVHREVQQFIGILARPLVAHTYLRSLGTAITRGGGCRQRIIRVLLDVLGLSTTKSSLIKV